MSNKRYDGYDSEDSEDGYDSGDGYDSEDGYNSEDGYDSEDVVTESEDVVTDSDKTEVIKLITNVLTDKKMNVVKYNKSSKIEHTIISEITGEEEITEYDGILDFINLFMELYGHHKLFVILKNIFNNAFYVAEDSLKQLRELKVIIETKQTYYDDSTLKIIESNYKTEVFGVLNKIMGPEVKIMKIKEEEVITQKELADSIEDIKSSITEDGQIYRHEKIFLTYIINIEKLSTNYKKYTYIEDVKSLINMIVKSLIILDKIYDFFKEIEKKVSQIEYKRKNAIQQQQQPGGFRKKNNLKPTVVQSKEILGKIRRIYKVAGSRKEHIKYKGELISVSDYKKLVSQAKALKSQNKPVAKPKAKPASKSAAKPAPKPATKSATKPKAKSATKSKAKPTAKSVTKAKAK